jgi:hypothetical protein
MIQNNLSNVPGIEFFPIIAFIIFFTVFVFVTIMVLSKSKKEIQSMSEAPLHDSLNNHSNS